MTAEVYLPPDATVAEIEGPLGRVRGPAAALVFPAGAACQLAAGEQLRELRGLCRALGKRVTIVGGDEDLRARAVAAGFAAATSLEAWEPERDERPASARGATGRAAWTAADAAFVTERGRRHRETSWSADPPEYVLWLLRREGTYPGPRETGDSATAGVDDAEPSDPLLAAHWGHEERITATIRATGSPRTTTTTTDVSGA
ncbi:MAG TPA: hypothetical protein VFU88_07615 [Ktedonobacterales bacterium]|nr:hypothetical protein [Ktedonobacterales bacterium]